MQRFLSEEFSKFVRDIKLSLEEAKKPSRHSLSALPVKYTKVFLIYNNIYCIMLSHLLKFHILSCRMN